MAFARGKDFNDRREDAANARKAMLERFKARPAVDDPDMVAKAAERAAIAEAREKRQAEREAARKAEEERLAAAKLAAEIAEMERLERERVRREEAEALLLAAQKAARDLRYANRKKTSKKRSARSTGRLEFPCKRPSRPSPSDSPGSASSSRSPPS